jgi:phospholipase C
MTRSSDHSHRFDPRRRRLLAGLAATTAGSVSLPGCSAPDSAAAGTLPAPADSGIDHIVVVMMENRSFDHLLGWVPGANGLQAGLQFPDAGGIGRNTHALTPDYQGCPLEDPPHGYDHGRTCVNGGAMDGFLLDSPVGDLFPIGYYNADDVPFYAGCAAQWTICDRYHSGILASTQPNRMYMHCGQTDRITTGSGRPKTSVLPTIWDAAQLAGISARYYYNNLPFTAIWNGRYRSISHVIADFYDDAAAGRLPAISYVDPFFYETGLDDLANDDHPFSDVRKGQIFLNGIYDALRQSPQWQRSLLVINYDEWGGFFDHVLPPFMPVSDYERNVVGNDGQLGIRVPCILIGPRVRRGHIESALLEPNSILKFMEWRWGLSQHGIRSSTTHNLAHALDFVNPPRREAPAFAMPSQVNPKICALSRGSANADSSEHAREVAWLQEKARAAGFRW